MRGDHGLVNAKAVQIGLGVDACGRKEVLGMLIAESETAFMKLLHLAVKKVTQKCKRSSPFGDFTIKRLVIADGVPELHRKSVPAGTGVDFFPHALWRNSTLRAFGVCG